MRTHAEWNVLTQIAFATGPTSAATRWRISSAALLVKVIARIAVGGTPSWMRWAMRWVSTRVLPEPAPATTSSGPPRCTTASSWSGFKPCRSVRPRLSDEESDWADMTVPLYGSGVTAIMNPLDVLEFDAMKAAILIESLTGNTWKAGEHI